MNSHGAFDDGILDISHDTVLRPSGVLGVFSVSVSCTRHLAMEISPSCKS